MPVLLQSLISAAGCVQANSYCHDERLRDPDSPEEKLPFDLCRGKCGENPDCNWISWHRGVFACHTFKTCTSKRPAVLSIDGDDDGNAEWWVTSPLQCPGSGLGCHIDDWAIPDNEANRAGLPSVEVSDAYECQRRCQQTENCKFFTLNGADIDVEKAECKLFANNGSWGQSLGHVSGPRDCESISHDLLSV